LFDIAGASAACVARHRARRGDFCGGIGSSPVSIFAFRVFVRFELTMNADPRGIAPAGGGGRAAARNTQGVCGFRSVPTPRPRKKATRRRRTSGLERGAAGWS
jgi:hypothetical protein